MNPLKVYIGYDSRESTAYDVACHSLRKQASAPVSITPIRLDRVDAWGMLQRPVEIRDGQMWDVISGAPQSTQFAISRFLVPMLAQTGVAVFVDCDVVFLDDVYEMVKSVEGKYGALFVVKHDYTPAEDIKMDGQAQTRYQRKNWSSVMVWNCDHPANQRLTLRMINSLPGRDLHRFCWLEDYDIGSLPPEWNWLVGAQPMPRIPRLAHFTLGGPWLGGWSRHEHDEIWEAAAYSMCNVRKGASHATSNSSAASRTHREALAQRE